MAEAPKPISSAHSSPRRAPSLIMDALTGPTGTERMKPLRNPVRAARRRGWPNISRRGSATVLLLFLFDFVADLARDARTDEPVQKVEGEDRGQDDGQDQPPQNHQSGQKENREHSLGKRAPRPQVEGLERRILEFANHHDREKQKDARQQIAPRPGGKIGLVL